MARTKESLSQEIKVARQEQQKRKNIERRQKQLTRARNRTIQLISEHGVNWQPLNTMRLKISGIHVDEHIDVALSLSYPINGTSAPEKASIDAVFSSRNKKNSTPLHSISVSLHDDNIVFKTAGMTADSVVTVQNDKFDRVFPLVGQLNTLTRRGLREGTVTR